MGIFGFSFCDQNEVKKGDYIGMKMQYGPIWNCEMPKYGSNVSGSVSKYSWGGGVEDGERDLI